MALILIGKIEGLFNYDVRVSLPAGRQAFQTRSFKKSLRLTQFNNILYRTFL
jgi:hypothetical protein